MRARNPNLVGSPPRRVRYIAGPAEVRRQRTARFAADTTLFALVQAGMLLLGFIGTAGAVRFLFTLFGLLLTLIFVACLPALFLRYVVFPDRRFLRFNRRIRTR